MDEVPRAEGGTMIANALSAALLAGGLGLAGTATDPHAAPGVLAYAAPAFDGGVVSTPLDEAGDDIEGAAATVEPTVEQASSDLVAALRGGEWWLAAIALVWLFVKLLRARKVLGWIPWLRTRAGGYTLAFSTAALVAIGAAAAAGETPSIGLLLGGLAAGVGAVGTHEASKDLKSAPSAPGAV